MREINWPIKALSDICEVFDDGDWIESKDQAPSGVRLIQTGNVGDGEFKNRSDKARFISESTFSRLRCTEIIPGDLLVSRLPDPVGRACLIPDTGSKMITAVDCTIMRPRKDIMLPQFLVSSTQTSAYRQQVRAKITGTTRDRISRSNLAEVQVSVPPLEEQKRIVALLDAATARVTELSACYELARTHANNLFTSASREELEGNSDWPIKTLGAVAELNPREPALSEDAPFVPMDAVNAGMRDVQYTQPRGQRSGARARAGDILFARITPCLQNGKVALVQVGIARCGGSTEFIVVRAGSEVLNGYLYQWITSDHIRDEVTALMKGATGRQRLNAEDLALTQLPVPSLEEQNRIVARLDSMRAKTSEMTAAYDAKLTAATNLRQSILEAAFAGQL